MNNNRREEPFQWLYKYIALISTDYDFWFWILFGDYKLQLNYNHFKNTNSVYFNLDKINLLSVFSPTRKELDTFKDIIE